MESTKGDGMAIKWKSGVTETNSGQVLKRICESASVDEKKGRVSFTFGNERHEGFAVLHTMLRFPRGLGYDSFQERTSISQAVTRVALDNNHTPSHFLYRLNEIAGKDSKKPESEYRLVTSLSVAPSFPIRQWQFEGCSIRLLPGDLPKKYASRVPKLQRQARKFEESHPGYSRCIVTVRAKNERSAAARALRALDVFRGYCNFFLNPQFQIIFNPSTETPVNVVRTGQCHTLHRKDGAVIQDQVWFEPHYRHTYPITIKSNQKFRQNHIQLAQLVGKSRYSDKLIESLLRYVRALDETDFNTGFLRLWAAIESLACPNGADYQTLVRRCAFLYEDPEYQKLVLDHLRDYRNSNIHAGEERDNVREYLFQAQRFFRALFSFHVEHTAWFSTLDEANEFLDFSTDAEKLLKMREQINRCLWFRRIERADNDA